jgi:hypothetical protein
MATYKKGYKKQNSEMLLLKTIVVIIVSVILIVAVAFIYDLTTSWNNYNNYDSVADYSEVFDLKDEEEVEIDNYLVYVYSNTCESCASIQRDVLKIADKLNSDSEMFFLVNTSDIEGESDDFLDTINQTQLLTPMLVVVVDGEFEEVFIGSTNVVDAMESMEAGTYAPFNE